MIILFRSKYKKYNLKYLYNSYNFLIKIKNIFILDLVIKMGIGDWGLGIGDWGLGIGANPQSPIPNPPFPIPNPHF